MLNLSRFLSIEATTPLPRRRAQPFYAPPPLSLPAIQLWIRSLLPLGMRCPLRIQAAGHRATTNSHGYMRETTDAKVSSEASDNENDKDNGNE